MVANLPAGASSGMGQATITLPQGGENAHNLATISSEVYCPARNGEINRCPTAFFFEPALSGL
jgi:hypothetical protein